MKLQLCCGDRCPCRAGWRGCAQGQPAGQPSRDSSVLWQLCVPSVPLPQQQQQRVTQNGDFFFFKREILIVIRT